MNISEQTQNVMRLLSQVILADGHILSSEVEALVSGVVAMSLSDNDGHRLTPPQIHAWFAVYLQDLNEASSAMSKEVALTHLILNLAEWPNKKAVVETLESISQADAQFHMEEKLLISIVKAYWQYDGLDAPGSTVMGVT